jgi:hypothetical protein
MPQRRKEIRVIKLPTLEDVAYWEQQQQNTGDRTKKKLEHFRWFLERVRNTSTTLDK